jgi:hypothetical protein
MAEQSLALHQSVWKKVLLCIDPKYFKKSHALHPKYLNKSLALDPNCLNTSIPSHPKFLK